MVPLFPLGRIVMTTNLQAKIQEANPEEELQQLINRHASGDWGELAEEDKGIVQRARKIQRFLSQPFFVAEQFTGRAGKYVKREDTVRGFKMIVDGELDAIPEQCFYMAGSIEEVMENAKKMQEVAPA